MEKFKNQTEAPIDAISSQDCTTERNEMDVGTKVNEMKINV